MAPSTSPAGAASHAVVCRWLNADQTIGTALSSNGRTLYAIAREGGTISCDCTGYSYRQYCRHTTALEAMLPVRLFPCGNCREATCPEPRTYCAGCLAQLKAECERIAALRQITPSTTEEIAATEAMLAELTRELPAALHAEREAQRANARAAASHTFAPGSSTLIQGSRPDPMAAFGYR